MNATMTLTSADFQNGTTVPDALVADTMGCSGGNMSPQLQWSNVPPGTKSFALALHDPDAPTTVGFTHWIVFDLHTDLRELESGAGRKHHNPHGSVHGMNDMGQNCYDGPCPPPGDPPHRYLFTLYALDLEKLPDADHRLTYPKFRFLIREHVLAEATITGRYAVAK